VLIDFMRVSSYNKVTETRLFANKPGGHL
jgi:hypothetical protein